VLALPARDRRTAAVSIDRCPRLDRALITAYRLGMPLGPDVTLRTTTYGHSIDDAKVVAGYGRDPGLAIRDLAKCARVTARDLVTEGDQFEVIGVTLVAGQVPDNTSTERHATAPGWAAYGTLIRRPAARYRRAG